MNPPTIKQHIRLMHIHTQLALNAFHMIFVPLVITCNPTGVLLVQTIIHIQNTQTQPDPTNTQLLVSLIPVPWSCCFHNVTAYLSFSPQHYPN